MSTPGNVDDGAKICASCPWMVSPGCGRLARMTRRNHHAPSLDLAPAEPLPTNARPQLEDVLAALRRRTFCVLASVSPAGRPHAAGVIYAWHDGTMFVSTLRSSRKARNIVHDPRVHVTVPVRRLPIGPPSSIAFAATAELLAPDDPAVTRLAGSGALRPITSHGELELTDGCILRVTPQGPLHTYGIGLSLWALVRDPLHAAGRVDLP